MARCCAARGSPTHSMSAGEQRKGRGEAERFGVPHFLATQYLRTKGIKLQLPNGVVSSVSFVSTTNTARSLAGFVSLALALTLWRSPGISEKLCSGLVGRHRSVVDLTADGALQDGRVDEGGFGVSMSR